LHIDSHTHIGQFEECYYDPLEIVETVMSNGIQRMVFSSTTSCIDNIKYNEIEKEIFTLQNKISYLPEIVSPYFWYIPEYILQGVNIENACNVIPYKGLKLHPYINHWNFADNRHMETLHSLFDYAAINSLPVLIHTGESGRDSADCFENFFEEYKMVQYILAHCRPLDVTIDMLRKYENVFCDTAFVHGTHIQTIITAGYREKILTGTDFPITHYFKTHYPQADEDQNITLREQYKLDIALIDVATH
jgi:predicted TIM-barrel fold metal-dependent hydrolase